MVEVKQKEAVGRRTREVDSTCAEGVRIDIAAGKHAMATDEPKARGGTDTAASPLEMLTASLAACQTVQVVKVAEAMRFNHGAINIHAEATTDMVDGIEGNNNGVMKFIAAGLVIDIETDESEKRLERLKALSEDRCSVGRLFEDAGAEVKIDWNLLPMKG
jgi:uncharacterized OsmC-like protein